MPERPTPRFPFAGPLLRAVAWRRKVRGPLRESWTLEHETLSRFLHHYARRSTLLPLRLQRAALDVLRPPERADVRIERVMANGVPGAWVRPVSADPHRVLYYLHGGGYSIGSIDSHRAFVAKLAKDAGVTAFLIDYRLAPEHRFPAQLDDARAAWQWLLGQGVDPKRTVIAGESAGGGLTMSTLVALKQAGGAMPAAAAVISPWVDLTLSGRSIEHNARYDYLPRHVLRTYVTRVVGAQDPRDPRISPLYADLTGLPPLLVIAGGAEAIVDDARELAARARTAGVEVELREHDDQIHAFPLFMHLPASRAAIAELAAFVRRHTAHEGHPLGR